MKYPNLLLCGVSALFLFVGCGKNGDSGSETFSTPSTTTASSPRPTLPPDSSQMAEARREFVNVVDNAHRNLRTALSAERPLSPGVAKTLESAFKNASDRIAAFPAGTVRDLGQFTRAELVNAYKSFVSEYTAEMTAKIPARVRPEAVVGEKRDLRDAQGNCTHDVVVDVAQFSVKGMQLIVHVFEFAIGDADGDPGSAMRNILDPYVTECFNLVDRYGSVGVCTNKITDSPAVIDMEKFKAACEVARDRSRAL